MVVYAVSAGYKWFLLIQDEHIETVNTLTILKIVLLYLEKLPSHGYNDKFLDSTIRWSKNMPY